MLSHGGPCQQAWFSTLWQLDHQSGHGCVHTWCHVLVRRTKVCPRDPQGSSSIWSSNIKGGWVECSCSSVGRTVAITLVRIGRCRQRPCLLALFFSRALFQSFPLGRVAHNNHVEGLCSLQRADGGLCDHGGHIAHCILRES